MPPTFTKPTTEFVLAATTIATGRPFPILDLGQGQVIMEPRAEHSRKPAVFRQRIEALCGQRSRIELFSRESASGWDSWGAEAGKLDETKRALRSLLATLQGHARGRLRAGIEGSDDMYAAIGTRVRMERATLASLGIHLIVALAIPALAWTASTAAPVETVSFMHVVRVEIAPPRAPPPAAAGGRAASQP